MRPIAENTVLVTASLLLLQLASLSLAVSQCPSYSDIQNELGKTLSSKASIDEDNRNAPRWSDFGAPNAAYVVNVASEADVATTVKYANRYELSFLTQSRGNGWADAFNLGACGIIINLISLNKITYNTDKTLATIQGGALVKDMIDSAYGNDTRFATPTCECLGFLGASLGGGLTREMGLYGVGADQIVSANIVLASGTLAYIDSTHNPDLWFAVRGAVSNFGIVTSAVVKAYPIEKSQNVGWQGLIPIPDDQLGPLITAVKNLDMKKEMAFDLLFTTSGPPNYTPTILVFLLYLGGSTEGEAAFKPILRLAPANNASSEIPYTLWGAPGGPFCMKGLRKPAFGVSTSTQSLSDASVWIEIYKEFQTFIKKYPGAVNSSLLTEYYYVETAVAIGKAGVQASYPWRTLPLHTAVIPAYADAYLDGPAEAFGSKARDLLRASDGYRNHTYINFAHGDETLEEIYGESLPRLQHLKKKYDPQNRFNQFFPLTPRDP